MEEILEHDEEIKRKIDEELSKMDAYSKGLAERVDAISTIHEDLVIIEKIDVRAMKSFLHFVEKSRFDQIRTSYYGRVLRISDVDTGDITKEEKKRRVQKGDIIMFNPDSAYSMNITVPIEYPEIWCLSIENILGIDRAFDPVAAKIKTVEANVLIERAKQEEFRQRMLNANAALNKSNPH